MGQQTPTDFASRFTPAVVAHRGGPFLTGDMLAALTLHAGNGLNAVWAPFDYITAGARLVVVGITPGKQQAENALAEFRAALLAGADQTEALRRAKLVGAFSGPIRENLVQMLDHIGVQRALGLRSSAEFFDPKRELVHLTSALRHPVLVGGENYNGTPDMLRTPILRHMVETHLAEEARALPNAIWLPLGPKPAAALAHLSAIGVLDPAQVLQGLPHPSGANGERIAYFLGRKARAALSVKTRPEPIDAARDRLVAQVARFAMPA